MGVRGRLLWLTLGVALPLIAVAVAGLWGVWTASRARIDEQIERSAELAAVAFEQWIEGQRQPLTATAAYVVENPLQTIALRDSLRYDLATRGHWVDVRIVEESGATEFALRSNLPPLSTQIVGELFRALT